MKSKPPVVLQLIDSLSLGGAERVSVNLANALDKSGIKSYLCSTRKGGDLETFINPKIELLILQKKSTFDFKALYRLVQFIKEHKINIIHAHSSSFFTAVLCKPFTGVKIVWHDHYGKAEQLDKRPVHAIIRASYFFDAVISVNEKLATWAKQNLHLKKENIMYLQNFAKLAMQDTQAALPGRKESRIVCLANLRPQKDHITLLTAFKSVLRKHPDWHLLLVGQDSKDTYSEQIKSYIRNEKLEEHVHILGSRSDSADILKQSTIAVLSSESEGLPVSLLEYGLSSLPVLCTDVGQCSKVLGEGKYGKIVPSVNSELFAKALSELIEDKKQRDQLALAFYRQVKAQYSQEAVMKKILTCYSEVLYG